MNPCSTKLYSSKLNYSYLKKIIQRGQKSKKTVIEVILKVYLFIKAIKKKRLAQILSVNFFRALEIN